MAGGKIVLTCPPKPKEPLNLWNLRCLPWSPLLYYTQSLTKLPKNMHYPIIDSVILLIVVYHFCIGCQKGLIDTLVGPASFFLACFYSYVSFQRSHNMLKSLLITLIVPTVIQLIYWMVKTMIKKKDEPKKPFRVTFANVLAGFVHASWSSTILALFLILVAYLPSTTPWFQHMQRDLVSSKSYKFLNTLSGNRLPSASTDAQQVVSTFQDPVWIKKFQSTQEYQDLSSDPRIQAVLTDETIQQQIKNHDIVDILKNPKFQAILQDKELMEKFMALNSKAMEIPK